MSNGCRAGLVPAVLVVWLSLAGRAPADYLVTDLGRLPGVGPYDTITPYGLNDAGQVVGSYGKGSNGIGAFLYSGGKMQDLGSLGGNVTAAYGINDAGQVVGYSTTPDGNEHAFLYQNGRMQDLGILGVARAINAAGQVAGTGVGGAFLYDHGRVVNLGNDTGDSGALAINSSGQVAGHAYPGVVHAALWAAGSDGHYTDLGQLGGPFAGFAAITATALNDAGQAVGYSPTANGTTHAFLYGNGRMTDLGTLAGPQGYSYASGINNAGQIVGLSMSPTGYVPFLYSDGQMKSLQSLIPADSGWRLGYAYAINEAGQIIGDGTNPGGQGAAYLLTPVTQTAPEPGGLTLAALGSLSLIGYACRRFRGARRRGAI